MTIAEPLRVWLLDSDPVLRWQVEVDCCINAYTLANGTWLGADVASLPGWFVEHQRDDGGWNCEWVEGADYFRKASRHDGVAPDPRVADAIDRIRAAGAADGTWVNQHVFPGAVWFPTEVPEGEPSKWLTLYCTLVLQWWDQSQ